MHISEKIKGDNDSTCVHVCTRCPCYGAYSLLCPLVSKMHFAVVTTKLRHRWAAHEKVIKTPQCKMCNCRIRQAVAGLVSKKVSAVAVPCHMGGEMFTFQHP